MRYLSSKNVAEILGINISTLKRWTDNGTLECTKTAGGHRKFTMQNIRDFYKSQENSGKNNDLGIDNRDHKKVYSLINKNDFDTLSTMLADASLESDDLTVSTIITGLYLKGLKVEDICDKVIDPGSIIVENALRQGYLTHVETFVSRKLITRATESLNQNKPNGSANGKTALCVNFEDNLPDLGVVMSEVVLRHYGYNVLNTGSHAELGNLQTIIEKKKVDLIVFYLCDMQCCMATVKDNINKTEEQTKIITKLANKLGVKVVFGGQGLEFLPSVKDHTDYTFLTYNEFKKIIT
ncbi:MAG: helix-turn-helix domain-containing protein [Candidatus Neomarinimicrobiota bacterium]